MSALHPGAVIWRIGRAGPVRGIVVRILPGGLLTVRASTFSRNETQARAEDVFADRESCRAEIQRRNEAAA
jgi:hypothetical protein